MIIETMSGKLVNADLVKDYKMCDNPEGDDYAGYSGNVFMMAFFDDGDHICLTVSHASTDATKESEYQRDWKKLQRALKNNVDFLSFAQ